MENKSKNVKTARNARKSRQIHFLYEPKNETQTEHSFLPSLSEIGFDELQTTIQVENYNEINRDLVSNMVKTELREFQGNDALENCDHDQSDTKSVILMQKTPETETEILGTKDPPPPVSSDEEDNPYNNVDVNFDSNSDPERDPFGDVDCDQGFSQTPRGQNYNDAAAQDELSNSAGTGTGANRSHSSNPSSSATVILTTAATSKPVRRRRKRNRNILQCQMCLEIHSSQSQLKTHVDLCAYVHKDRTRFCSHCNKILSTRQKYRQHALQRHGVEEAKLNRHPIECPFCHYTFALEESLAVHLASHHNESTISKTGEGGSNSNLKRFKCTQCPSSYKHHCDYIRHTQRHQNDRAFKCPMANCERAFKFQHSLKTHLLRIHSDEKPCKCPEPDCGKAYKSNHQLKNHMVTHSDERPCKCSQPGCEKTFMNKVRLDQHLYRFHKRAHRVEKIAVTTAVTRDP